MKHGTKEKKLLLMQATVIALVSSVLSLAINYLIPGEVVTSKFGFFVAQGMLLPMFTAICISSFVISKLFAKKIHKEQSKYDDKIQHMQSQVIQGLGNIIECRDVSTGDHVKRVSGYVNRIARELGKKERYKEVLSEMNVHILVTLSALHDIGKIQISDKILNKPGKLTEEEYDEIKTHPLRGSKMLEQIFVGAENELLLNNARDIVLYHHEHWDGTGYPCGLKGEEIPLYARIVAVADVYDALVSERCYKKSISKAEALKIIRDEKGGQLDPESVDAFLRVI